MMNDANLQHARIRVQRAKSELVAVTVFIRSTLDRVDEALRDRVNLVINPLGELQRSAQDYDRLCTEISTWNEIVKMLEENV